MLITEFSMQRKTANYNDKIKTIISYFGISENAAKYMFHRRRRGFPWKTEDDIKHLKWTIQLQNALIKADTLPNFDWVNLKFANDIQLLMESGINVDDQPNVVNIKKVINEEDNNGWTVVTKKKSNLIQKHILKNIGLLPKKKKIFLYKKNTQLSEN